MVDSVVVGLRYGVSVLSALAFLENLVVILILAGTRGRRVRHYGLVFNLAVSDLLFAAFSTAFPWTGYSIIYSLLMTGYVVSVLTTLGVALNRYLALAVRQPSRYGMLVKGRHLFGLCLVIWCFSVFMNLLPIMTSSQEVTLLINGLFRPVTVFLSWLITAVLYIVLCCKIKTRTRPDLNYICLETSPGETGQTTQTKLHQILVTVVLILLVSLASWMPNSIIRLAGFVDPSHFVNHNLDTAYWLTGALYCISAIANPFIYCVRSDGGFRGEIYSLLEDSKEMEAENEETVVDINV